MNTKDNQRTRLSRMLFRNAMLDLMEEKKSVTKISVKEICEKAELNRSTFYAHYDEPKNILEEIENELIEATKEHIQKIGAEVDAAANKYILSFLQYIKDNDKKFRILLVDSMDPGFRTKFMNQTIALFVDNLQIDPPQEIEQYVYSYILNGNTGILIQWIRSGYAVNEETIVNLLFSINSNALIGM